MLRFISKYTFFCKKGEIPYHCLESIDLNDSSNSDTVDGFDLIPETATGIRQYFHAIDLDDNYVVIVRREPPALSNSHGRETLRHNVLCWIFKRTDFDLSAFKAQSEEYLEKSLTKKCVLWQNYCDRKILHLFYDCTHFYDEYAPKIIKNDTK